jgi:hypothetical protein
VTRTVEGDATFYWPETSQPAQWEDFRVADDLEESKRQLDELCAEELGNLAMFILSEHGGTSVGELARSICRLQRIARTSADAEARITRALEVGRARELIRLNVGMVSLAKWPSQSANISST